MKQPEHFDIYEVAEKCGVSIATVSRVINGRDNVKESTRMKVEQTIAKLGYVPSDVARGLSTKKTSLIGVAIPGINNYFGDKLESLFVTARETGYTVLVSGNIKASNDQDAELDQLDSFIEKRVEGLIVFISKSSENLRSRLGEISGKIPVVVFGQDLVHEGITSIIRDDDSGMRQMVRHLVSKGHKEIIHLRGPLYDPAAGIRADAFIDEMKKNHLYAGEENIFQGFFSLASGYRSGIEICSRIRAGKLACTAMLCGNDNMAIGFMRACAETGVRVPEDLSVTGMDDLEISSYFNPSLTTMKEDNAAIGRTAAELLHTHIMKKKYAPQRIVFNQELVIRNSVLDRRGK
jgi:DNA-binding LacI/PurR family transcriptional regulator